MQETTQGAAQLRYSGVAIALHWILALALAFQLALGWAMPKDASGYTLFQLHKSVGITILVLTLARIAWRLVRKPPLATEGGWGGALAKAVHVLLYVFMIGAPLTGWALVSTADFKVPTVLFGVIPWPHLPLPGALGEPIEEAHELLALLGIALILLHILGALRHQLLLKDGLLRRIAPGGSALLGGLLALAVVVVYFATGMTVAKPAGPEVYQENPEGPDQAALVPPGQAQADPTAEASASPTAETTPDATESPDAVATPAGPPPSWTIQPGGRLAFSVGNNGETLRGSFSDWSGTIAFDPEAPDNAPDIRITVRLASASLGDATQDGMLQDGEFFASAANPTATFRSTSVRRTGSGRYTASGTLSLKGASRPQTVTFSLSGNGMRRKVEGTGSISRNAFGVGTGESAAGLDSSVALTFSFDAVGK
jgi:cytochrome b561/polyisoprenoid-binding protein YceI